MTRTREISRQFPSEESISFLKTKNISAKKNAWYLLIANKRKFHEIYELIRMVTNSLYVQSLNMMTP